MSTPVESVRVRVRINLFLSLTTIKLSLVLSCLYGGHIPPGGIHPRVKRIVGERLAVAARKVAYADDKVVWTGPVLRSCAVSTVVLHTFIDQSM